MKQHLIIHLFTGAWLVTQSWAGPPVGILIEKSGAMFNAPVKGFKSTVGTAVLELDMNKNAATGKAYCLKMKDAGCPLVFTVGKGATKIAMQELPGIPLVYSMVMTPKKNGITGNSITGVTLDIPMTKQFEAFRSVFPGLKKLGLVYSKNTSDKLAAEMEAASKSMGITLISKKVAGDAQVPQAIRNLKGQINGLYLPPDRTVAKRDAFQFIALFTFENNLPFMAPTGRFVKKGALVGLMIDYEDMGKQAGEMAKKILGGTAVSSVPVQPPRATILMLNQKTAETIGINIPPGIMEKSQIIR